MKKDIELERMLNEVSQKYLGRTGNGKMEFKRGAHGH